MGHYQLKTRRGYDFYAVSSALQKAIRRGDARTAGYFGIELFESNFAEYLWGRLLTISAEDCWGLITQEVEALYNSYNRSKSKGKPQRIFVAKAIIILCMCKKCRDADHLTNFVYDQKIVDLEKVESYLRETKDKDIPEYAYDCHTREGKKRGKTREHFFEEEFNALNPREKGLFDGIHCAQGRAC